MTLYDYLVNMGVIDTSVSSTDELKKISYDSIIEKFIENSITTTSEINNIKIISVKKWGNQVTNKADEVKLSMYGIATDENLGLAGVINKRFALINVLLNRLGDDLSNLNIENTFTTTVDNEEKDRLDLLLADKTGSATAKDPTSITENEYVDGVLKEVDKTSLYKFFLDYKGLVKVWNSLCTDINTLTTSINNEVTRATAEEKAINDNIDEIEEDITSLKEKDTELDSTIQKQFNTANTYTDTEVAKVKSIVSDLTNGAPETLDTFKEVSEKLDEVDKKLTEFEEDHEDFINDINNLTTTTKIDSTTTAVECTLANNYDYSYTADNISSITINIPSSIEHGFACGINFKTGSSYPAFTINNKSSYDLKKIVNGVVFDTVTLKANQLYNCICLCNGMGIIFQLLEMDK